MLSITKNLVTLNHLLPEDKVSMCRLDLACLEQMLQFYQFRIVIGQSYFAGDQLEVLVVLFLEFCLAH